MTCIVAFQDKNKIILAGERRESTETTYSRAAISKVIKRNSALIGASGLGYGCSLITNCLNISIPRKMSITDFLLQCIPDRIHKLFKEKHLFEDRIVGTDLDVQAILVVKKHVAIINISGAFGITVDITSLPCAIGSGSDLSLGALHVYDSLIDDIKVDFPLDCKLEKIFKAVAQFNNACDDNYDFVSVEYR